MKENWSSAELLHGQISKGFSEGITVFNSGLLWASVDGRDSITLKHRPSDCLGASMLLWEGKKKEIPTTNNYEFCLCMKKVGEKISAYSGIVFQIGNLFLFYYFHAGKVSKQQTFQQVW